MSEQERRLGITGKEPDLLGYHQIFEESEIYPVPL